MDARFDFFFTFSRFFQILFSFSCTYSARSPTNGIDRLHRVHRPWACRNKSFNKINILMILWYCDFISGMRTFFDCLLTMCYIKYGCNVLAKKQNSRFFYGFHLCLCRWKRHHYLAVLFCWHFFLFFTLSDVDIQWTT